LQAVNHNGACSVICTSVQFRLKDCSYTTHIKLFTKCLYHGKLFIGNPCKKRADNLLKLSRRQLKVVVAILTGHAPVRGHLYIMGLFDGDPTCRFCRKETETVQLIICCSEALARHRYSVFGNSLVEPKDIITASVHDVCLFIRGTGPLNLC
jgi:hypothetical protein